MDNTYSAWSGMLSDWIILKSCSSIGTWSSQDGHFGKISIDLPCLDAIKILNIDRRSRSLFTFNWQVLQHSSRCSKGCIAKHFSHWLSDSRLPVLKSGNPEMEGWEMRIQLWINQLCCLFSLRKFYWWPLVQKGLTDSELDCIMCWAMWSVWIQKIQTNSVPMALTMKCLWSAAQYIPLCCHFLLVQFNPCTA